MIRDIDRNAKVRRVAAGIVQLAHSLDMRVVAEGVERREQCDALHDIGCDELQGYWVLPPQPQEQFERFYEDYAAGRPPG
ncbi:MAG: EAL domain-containing protein [Alicyclobacillaceae bacterium]|nr:EAL domain-containing protein [Alicyclobacillaceae bacterium]